MQNTKIKLVQAIYEAKPEIKDDVVKSVVALVFAGDYASISELHSFEPSDKTLSVWKARLRKKGVQIPDKRLKGK